MECTVCEVRSPKLVWHTHCWDCARSTVRKDYIRYECSQVHKVIYLDLKIRNQNNKLNELRQRAIAAKELALKAKEKYTAYQNKYKNG